VPVRIALDVGELKDNPLRVGLSVTAEVDVHDQSGSRFANTPVTGVMRGETGQDVDARVDAMVARILRENGVR
jgi:membrane fusion protein (multidrug efflux system)